MDNISNFKDETGERLLETGKKTVKNVARGVAQTVKGQVVGNVQDQTKDNSGGIKDEALDKGNRKIDPVTGKPIPSRKVLGQLNEQVAQLAQMRIKRVREELERQRLKVKGDGPSSAKATAGEAGPEVPAEQEKPKEDVISKVLKASKSTGEFGKNIGG